MNSVDSNIVLRVDDLRVSFTSILGDQSDAVRGVSFTLQRGKTLALVGESGSGKTVTSYSILRLIQPPGKIAGGSIVFYPRNESPIDITALSPKADALFRLRGGKIGMIFQEPMTALSPVHTVGNQICEAILLHRKCAPDHAKNKAIEMLEKVGITDPARRMKQFPFELSGGLRQRVVIAMALVCRPEILIADEPTTALDVTMQAQILQLIRELQAEMNAAVLFITHDLGVVAKIADDVAVMQNGRIVETAPVRDLFRHPYHPYTRKLLASTPHARLDPTIRQRLENLTPPTDLPAGWTIASSSDRTSSRLHQFADGRSLLLWSANVPNGSARMISADSEPSVQPLPLLQVRNLVKRFETRTRRWFSSRVETFDAVANVSFDVHPGETLGIVGESGSGKTTLARCILRALQPTRGEVIFSHQGRSVDLATLEDRELKPLRQQMQMIFQDPFSSLNPRMTVGDIVAEPLVIHRIGTHAERQTRVAAMLHRVGLSQDHMSRYPHAFSGGQRQRIGIARALILRPAFIVADEAVSALDVSVQSRILDLLQELRRELKLTCIFVSHDLSIVRQICDRVAVMHRGRIVEMGTSEQVFTSPRHAYTRVLLSAIPYPDPDREFHPLRVKDLTEEELEPL